MAKPSKVIIIYNPNSTGDGRKNAREFQAALKNKGISSELVATKHAGHAVDLARDFADKHPEGMVVSSSGDGGYHEVVNGVLSSKNPGVITGLLPSGNANDHYHFVHQGDTDQRVAAGKTKQLDMLKVVTPDWTHFAHSYVGLGMTPQIGQELTKHSLNRLKESWLVLKNIFVLKTVKIKRRSRVLRYKNLVFSNTGRMSKYLTLSKDARTDDGKFEITRVSDHSLLGLLRHLVRATANQIDSAPQASYYTFTALSNLSVQLDGEVYPVLSGQKVVITCEPKKLKTII